MKYIEYKLVFAVQDKHWPTEDKPSAEATRARTLEVIESAFGTEDVADTICEGLGLANWDWKRGDVTDWPVGDKFNAPDIVETEDYDTDTHIYDNWSDTARKGIRCLLGIEE